MKESPKTEKLETLEELKSQVTALDSGIEELNRNFDPNKLNELTRLVLERRELARRIAELEEKK